MMSQASEKVIVNWLKGQYAAALNNEHLSFETPRVSAKTMAQLLDKLHENSISLTNARSLFAFLWAGEEDIDALIEREGYQKVEDTAGLEEMIASLLLQFPEQTAEYRAGKERLLAFFVGQMMKQTKGQANPELINTLLKKHLAG